MKGGGRAGSRAEGAGWPWFLGKRMAGAACLLVLAARAAAATTDAEPPAALRVEDEAIRVELEQTLERLEGGGGAAILRDILARAPAGPVRLSVVGSGRRAAAARVTPEELVQRLRGATVVYAHRYLCSRCNARHLQTAAGVMVAPGGYFVTAAHCVRIAEGEVAVVWSADEGVLPVDGWVHIDDQADVALLRASGLTAPPLPVAAAPPRPGTDVHLMGHPRNHFFYYSRGVVARAIHLTRPGTERAPWLMLEVTAPFGRGSSGGPVLDSRGCLVGVISATEAISTGPHTETDSYVQMVVGQVSSIAPLVETLGGR